MVYAIILTPQARRQLGELPPVVRPIIADAIDALASDPRPHGVEKLSGTDA